MKQRLRWMDIRIGQRLALAFGLVIAVLIGLASVAWVRIAALNDVTATLVGSRYPSTVLAQDLKSTVGDISRSMLGVLVMTDDGQTKKELATLETLAKAHDTGFKALAGEASDPESLALLKELEGLRARVLPAQSAFVALVADGNKEEALVKYLFAVRAVQARYLAGLDKFVKLQDAAMQAAGADSALHARQTGRLILGVAVLAILASVAMGALTTRSITRPLTRAVRIAKKVAAGDLSSRIEARSNDETGQLLGALHDMTESLRGIVGDVRRGTDSIASASEQIATGNLDLSVRTETQAGTLEQTAHAMRGLTDIVRSNADTARQASDLAGTACTVATEGGSVVDEVVQTMGSIETSSRRVADIVAVIDGIAFQTNILALNAAVEAARSGEQGRGFAVVAGEVRNLAQRSAAAAKEIKTLIGESVGQVERGGLLVGRAGTTMQVVVTRVQQVATLIGEIAASSRHQSDGIESVNQTLFQIDAATQQNAALVEQAAAATESLKRQAAALAETASQFKLDPSPA